MTGIFLTDDRKRWTEDASVKVLAAKLFSGEPLEESWLEFFIQVETKRMLHKTTGPERGLDPNFMVFTNFWRKTGWAIIEVFTRNFDKWT